MKYTRKERATKGGMPKGGKGQDCLFLLRTGEGGVGKREWGLKLNKEQRTKNKEQRRKRKEKKRKEKKRKEKKERKKEREKKSGRKGNH